MECGHGFGDHIPPEGDKGLLLEGLHLLAYPGGTRGSVWGKGSIGGAEMMLPLVLIDYFTTSNWRRTCGYISRQHHKILLPCVTSCTNPKKSRSWKLTFTSLVHHGV
ncbi:hypothetical protein CHARACLAT_030311 [Characodon lateralis]|uniref:Uncharacterized protein n=1 Tax=Characodon lateralis TaxID=208331 RepID=A0ABU7DEA8_9TELE|nr:hypothetical protein [Characodon lateralis]